MIGRIIGVFCLCGKSPNPRFHPQRHAHRQCARPKKESLAVSIWRALIRREGREGRNTPIEAIRKPGSQPKARGDSRMRSAILRKNDQNTLASVPAKQTLRAATGKDYQAQRASARLWIAQGLL